MSDCRSPALGAHVDGYVDGSLPDSTRDAFEQHLFECPACLQAVEARQAIAGTLRDAGRPPSPRLRRAAMAAVLGIAALVVAAAILVPLMRGPRTPSTTPFVLTLEGTVRAETSAPVAPADTPLTLALRAPIPTDRQASYDVRVVDANGRVVREVSGLSPTSPNEVRVDVGELPAGSFEAVLRELAASDGTPLELRYRFTVADSRSR